MRKQTLVPETIDTGELVAATYDMIRHTLAEAVEIEILTTGGLWRYRADRSQLGNAILNLAFNARDAMPQDNLLTIETANENLAEGEIFANNPVQSGKYVMISVADTGTGMPPEVLEHVFEPFFSTKGVGQGSGLGLSMVHGFISQSDGFVQIESHLDSGTRAKIFLPATAENGDDKKKLEPAMDTRQRDEKVLLMEDDPEVRRLILSMLTKLDYQIIEAANGEQAMAAHDGNAGFELLLADVVLPGGMTGVDIAKEVTQRLPDIKILLVSGHPDDILAQCGPLATVLRMLRKPIQMEDLAHSLREVLDERVS